MIWNQSQPQCSTKGLIEDDFPWGFSELQKLQIERISEAGNHQCCTLCTVQSRSEEAQWRCELVYPEQREMVRCGGTEPRCRRECGRQRCLQNICFTKHPNTLSPYHHCVHSNLANHFPSCDHCPRLIWDDTGCAIKPVTSPEHTATIRTNFHEQSSGDNYGLNMWDCHYNHWVMPRDFLWSESLMLVIDISPALLHTTHSVNDLTRISD